MRNLLLRLAKTWDQFFFGRAPELPLAAFRIAFSVNAFAMYAIRFCDWRFYFTDVGFVKSEWALEILPEFFRPSVALLPTTEGMALGLHVLFLIALALLALGVFSRGAALVAFVLHLAFLQRNFSIAYGADIVNTFFLFALLFMESDRRLSVRALLGRVREQSQLSGWLSNIGMRFVQIQLCIIYGYTGMEKLKGPTWWDGSAVWAVLGNPQIMMFDMSWLRHFPLVIALMTLGTVAWEIYFPVLVWVKPLRKWVLLGGMLLHVGIAIGVGLIFFSTAMCSAYLVFVNEAALTNMLKRIRS